MTTRRFFPQEPSRLRDTAVVLVWKCVFLLLSLHILTGRVEKACVFVFMIIMLHPSSGGCRIYTPLPPPTLFRQAGHDSMGGKGKMSPCGRDKHAQTENDRSWGLAMTAACSALFGRAFFVCFECRRIHFDSKRVESRPGVENKVLFWDCTCLAILIFSITIMPKDHKRNFVFVCDLQNSVL